MAINEIQALTYPTGHHSTFDDSSKYRPIKEIEWWRLAQDPVARFQKSLEGDGWWNSQAESELRDTTRKEVLHTTQVAEKIEKPGLEEIFSDVYDVPPPNLCYQEKSLRETVEKHQQDYPPDFP